MTLTQAPRTVSNTAFDTVAVSTAAPSALPSLGEHALRQVLVPLISLVSASGMVLIALAYNAARSEASFAEGLFWAGLVLLFGPLAAGLLGSTATRGERMALITLLGAGAYVVKVAYSPLVFQFPDELQHVRTLHDILQSGTLFSFNPILQVSALYPGLEVATSALVNATGLSEFLAGLLIVGAARLLLCLSLFLFYEQLAGSARVAGLASMFYMANPNFMYLDGQFGYESLALALVALVLYSLLRQRTASGRQLIALMGISFLAVGAVVITHHFSQFVLAGLLAAWALAGLAIAVLRRNALSVEERRARWREVARVGLTAGVCAAVATAWLVRVAGPLVDYLGPNFTIGFLELAQLLSGQTPVRVPFRNGAGVQTALPEQAVGYLSVLCVVAALPLGLRLLWRHYRFDGAALGLGALSAAYPATLLLRFTPDGVATAGRLPEFLFLGLAFVLALVAAQIRPARLARGLWRSALLASSLVVLIGGAFTGWGPPGRLPGPFLVSADARSVDAQSLAIANWARTVLGPQNVMAADLNHTLVLGSYGQQYLVSVSNSHVDASEVFFAPSLGDFQREIIQQAHIRYVVVDWRLARGLPVAGFYYEHQEPDAFQHTQPMDMAAFQKFDVADGVSRVFDSGDVTIYDMAGPPNAP
jgi:hypothetical protein